MLQTMDKYVKLAKEIVLKTVQDAPFQVFLFGSRAINSNNKFSDIDIGLLGETPIPVMLKVEIENAIEESIVPYKVDIVDFYKVSEAFKKEALRHIEIWKKASVA